MAKNNQVQAGNVPPAKLTLVEVGTENTKAFDRAHALRILKREEKSRFSSWALPADSDYIFKNGDLITKAGPGLTRGTGEQKANTEGAQTRASDADAHGANPAT